MSRRNRLERTKGRSSKARPFLMLDLGMLRSAEWARLSPFAMRLIVDLGTQFNGGNNGDLCATWALMKARGWRSPGTLRRAIVEATGAGFVQLTRQGGRHCPSLFALTFFPIHECGGKLEVRSSPVASHAWRKNALPGPVAHQSSPKVYQLNPLEGRQAA